MNGRTLDVDALLRHYADDVVHEEPAFAVPLTGKEAFRENLESWLGAFRDARLVPALVIREGTRVAMLLRAVGTNAGEIVVANGMRFPPTGNRAELDVVTFMDFDDEGCIRWETRVYDTGGLIQQLDISPSSCRANSRRRSTEGSPERARLPQRLK